jgi:SulP family sulfate permease
MTVGVSNVISGLSGGYTGSYIFSQSIFSLRAGIRSRVAGLVLAACQLMVLISPYPILQFIPNFLFASLLSMICVDLMYEWLWDVRRTITRAEYCVCLATFVLIQCFGVEWGILAGVLLYIMSSKFGMDVGNSKIAEEGKVPYKGENGTNYGSTTTVR